MSGDILDQIDHALDDWTVSGDAMRWAPEPPADVTRPARPSPVTPHPRSPNWCDPDFADRASIIDDWLRGIGTYAALAHLVLAEPEQCRPEQFTARPSATSGLAFKRVILRRAWLCRVAGRGLTPEFYPAAIDQDDRVVLTGPIARTDRHLGR